MAYYANHQYISETSILSCEMTKDNTVFTVLTLHCNKKNSVPHNFSLIGKNPACIHKVNFALTQFYPANCIF
jgi:hypothetical protein